jgi:hypothetical protein
LVVDNRGGIPRFRHFDLAYCAAKEHLMPENRLEVQMSTATILIEVDADSARAFSQASAEDRRKLQLLLNLRLRELTATAARPLHEVMDEIGRRAEKRGMTPTVLDSLLKDG